MKSQSRNFYNKSNELAYAATYNKKQSRIDITCHHEPCLDNIYEVAEYMRFLNNSVGVFTILNDMRGSSTVWVKLLEWSEQYSNSLQEGQGWYVANVVNNLLQATVYKNYLFHNLSSNVVLEIFKKLTEAEAWLKECNNLLVKLNE